MTLTGMQQLFAFHNKRQRGREAEASIGPSHKRNRVTSLLFMTGSKTIADLCKVLTGNFIDPDTPSLSWDESSSSDNTWLRPCLKVATQEQSVKRSYYSGDVAMGYQVDFSMQTVYFHDLTVQLLRDPDDVKEKLLNAHSIAMQPDPWQVAVSSVPVDTIPSTKEERNERISRWSRATRERLWAEFCQESKVEREQKQLKEFRLAEKDLDEVTSNEADLEEFDEQTEKLHEALRAMEDIW